MFKNCYLLESSKCILFAMDSRWLVSSDYLGFQHITCIFHALISRVLHGKIFKKYSNKNGKKGPKIQKQFLKQATLHVYLGLNGYLGP